MRRNFKESAAKYKCKACEYGFFAKKAYDKHRKTQGHKNKEKEINEKRALITNDAGEQGAPLLDEVRGLQ